MVNPAARSDKGSPIYGMPILNSNKAKKYFIVKRGDGEGCAGEGCAGIGNTLFHANSISTACGDALALLQKMTEPVNKSFGLPAAARTSS